MATDKTEDLPCDDEEYARSIEYLSVHCAAFQRYRRKTEKQIEDLKKACDEKGVKP